MIQNPKCEILQICPEKLLLNYFFIEQYLSKKLLLLHKVYNVSRAIKSRSFASSGLYPACIRSYGCSGFENYILLCKHIRCMSCI